MENPFAQFHKESRETFRIKINKAQLKNMILFSDRNVKYIHKI